MHCHREYFQPSLFFGLPSSPSPRLHKCYHKFPPALRYRRAKHKIQPTIFLGGGYALSGRLSATFGRFYRGMNKNASLTDIEKSLGERNARYTSRIFLCTPWWIGAEGRLPMLDTLARTPFQLFFVTDPAAAERFTHLRASRVIHVFAFRRLPR